MAHRVVAICTKEDRAFFLQLDRRLAPAKAEGLLVLRCTTDFIDDADLMSAIDEADMILVFLTPALITSSLWGIGQANGLENVKVFSALAARRKGKANGFRDVKLFLRPILLGRHGPPAPGLKS